MLRSEKNCSKSTLCSLSFSWRLRDIEISFSDIFGYFTLYILRNVLYAIKIFTILYRNIYCPYFQRRVLLNDLRTPIADCLSGVYRIEKYFRLFFYFNCSVCASHKVKFTRNHRSSEKNDWMLLRAMPYKRQATLTALIPYVATNTVQ